MYRIARVCSPRLESSGAFGGGGALSKSILAPSSSKGWNSDSALLIAALMPLVLTYSQLFSLNEASAHIACLLVFTDTKPPLNIHLY